MVETVAVDWTPWLAVAVVAIALFLLWFAWRVLAELRRLKSRDHSESLQLLQHQMDGLRDQVRASLEGNRLEIGQRLAETRKVVGDVHRGLGEVDKQVGAVGAVARDLRGLQELLRSPKIRGGIGETLLAELLAQVLPQSAFNLQYRFSDGALVDAVVRVGDRLVPVDSKFPLENFQQYRKADVAGDDRTAGTHRRMFRADVRKHVDAVATKYIRPGEGTFEFGLMYLPAEAIYGELLQDADDASADLLQYALSRRVVPVSPQSFYAYLQVIVMGLKGFAVEESARRVMDRVAETRTRLDRFSGSFDTLQRHLGHAQRQSEESKRRLDELVDSVSTLLEIDSTTVESDRSAP